MDTRNVHAHTEHLITRAGCIFCQSAINNSTKSTGFINSALQPKNTINTVVHFQDTPPPLARLCTKPLCTKRKQSIRRVSILGATKYRWRSQKQTNSKPTRTKPNSNPSQHKNMPAKANPIQSNHSPMQYIRIQCNTS